ncbi:MAG: hypothetical protein ACKO96_42355, partial [Flammeovirgaceae bacterium]
MTPKIGIYNHLTGEDNIREMTADELAEFEQQSAAYLTEKTAKETEAAQLRATKISAYQKMGLTKAEITALLGLTEEE